MLWFDVEKRYKAITCLVSVSWSKLWFDVEKRYKAIHEGSCGIAEGCGLM